MRTKQEIKHAVAILRQKGDALSLVQAAVIEYQRTESWVFGHYVQNVSADEKDEATFFAARDAARYVTGGIALEELIMDAETYAAAPIEEKESSASDEGIIQMLIRRIDALEKQVRELKKNNCSSPVLLNNAEWDKEGFMTFAEAVLYVGCGQTTFSRWARKGKIRKYKQGHQPYYKKSELDANPIVCDYMNQKKAEP